MNIKHLNLGLCAAAAMFAASVMLPVKATAQSYEQTGQTVAKQEASKQASVQAAGQVASRAAGAVGGSFAGGGFGPGGSAIQSFNEGDSSGSLALFAFGNGSGETTGKAAGAAQPRLGIWGNIGWTDIKKDDAGSAADFEGNVLTGTVGADYKFTDNVLAGLAFGYENQDIDTGGGTGTLEGQGGTIAPYAAITLSPTLMIDATLGYSRVDYDSTRAGGVSGSTTGNRIFGAANLNAAILSKGPLSMIGSVGYLYVHEDQDAFTESDGTVNDEVGIRLGQFRGKLGAAYKVDTSFGFIEPSVSARAEYDNVHNSASVINAAGDKNSNDRFGVTFGAGIKAGIGENFTLDLKGESTQFRSGLDVTSVSGTARYTLDF